MLKVFKTEGERRRSGSMHRMRSRFVFGRHCVIPKRAVPRCKFALFSALPLALLSGCAVSDSATIPDEPTVQDGLLAVAVDWPSLSAQRPVPEAPKQPQEQKRPQHTFEVERPVVGSPHPDVWSRLRDGLSLQRPLNPTVRKSLRWFTKNPTYLSRISSRAQLYLPYILREAKRRQLPVELALLPIVESDFQPFAYSPASAGGLWQFIPATAAQFDLEINDWYDGRRDVVASTAAALDYLESLNRRVGGDWLLTVAAYNWGEGRVIRAVGNNRRAGQPTDFWSLRLPSETRGHIPKWLAITELLAKPEKYGIELENLPDESYFATVKLDAPIDLGLAAELADTPLVTMELLNAGSMWWTTPISGPYRLLVPAKKIDTFLDRIAHLPKHKWVRYRQHVAINGETLEDIAAKYRIPVGMLRDINSLKGQPESGQSLRVLVSYLAQQEYQYVAGSGGRRPGQFNQRYTVKNGDSLWTIARAHDVTINGLTQWNGLNRKSILRPGQKLVIKTTPKKPTHKKPKAHPAASSSPRYVVKSGDSLWTIARRYGVSTADLVRWNQVRREANLQPGQKLVVRGKPIKGTTTHVVPAAASTPQKQQREYAVRSGDSLWLIARRFGVTVDALCEWNDLVPTSLLKPGQTLRLWLPNAGSSTST